MSRVSSDESILSMHTYKGVSTHVSNEEYPITKVHTSGHGEEFIIIGNQKFYRHELMSAFAGTMNTGLAPYPKYHFGNATSLGLFSVGMTSLLSGFYNAHTMGIQTTNALVGVACFVGGFTEFIAGVWEAFNGNAFAMTAFVSYGAFWIQYAAINIEAFGMAAAYTGTDQMNNAVGLGLAGWAIFSSMLLLCTLKSTVALVVLFTTMTSTYILNSAFCFTGHPGVGVAGGYFGIITGFLAFYNAYAGVATKENTYFLAVDMPMPNAQF